MKANKQDIYGLIKTRIDAHTMGIRAAASLLSECGYNVIIAPPQVEESMQQIESESAQNLIVEWIKEKKISRIGFSYRLDPNTAVELFGRLVYMLKKEGLFEKEDYQIKSIFFAGLLEGCEIVEKEYFGRIHTFKGGETAEESLLSMGIPYKDIPRTILKGCKYDKELLRFGESIVREGNYLSYVAPKRNGYKEYGSNKDSVELRLKNNYEGEFKPLIRAHLGPYSQEITREENIKEYCEWCRRLAKTGLLDVLSIGTSQLSQSNFGEKWNGRINGGGVPVNTEKDYLDIWNAARPMLVRTYSGTRNIKKLAQIYEHTINISWHALSLWWFDELDGRGPNSLYSNLREHFETIKYIVSTNKPLETNISHHFAFRGCDDITYVLSGVLGAKVAKKMGIKTFVLQNMLNTPRSTWGIQDIAKSRALLSIVKELEDREFRVLLQTRAGLDYFKPDMEYAKAQLAAVTAMMDDIDPLNIYSPDLIHVVSFSEALFLATPEVLNESIQITMSALNEYRKRKREGLTSNVVTNDIKNRQDIIVKSVKRIIKAMEETIPDLYSPEGLYLAFVAGWLPVPELWSDSSEFLYAKCWQTKMTQGSVILLDNEKPISIEQRINKCISNLVDAEYNLRSRNF